MALSFVCGGRQKTNIKWGKSFFVTTDWALCTIQRKSCFHGTGFIGCSTSAHEISIAERKSKTHNGSLLRSHFELPGKFPSNRFLNQRVLNRSYNCVTLLLCSAIAVFHWGCDISLFSEFETPEVRSVASRSHIRTREPVVLLNPLLDRDNEIVSVLVRVPIADLTESEKLRLMSNSPVNGKERVLVLSEGQGSLRVIADRQEFRFNSESIAGGPWIFYLNEDQPFRRIQIAQADIKRFRNDVGRLRPLEFIEKWCDSKTGEPIPFVPYRQTGKFHC